ncbi:hypothetical protein FRB94_014790 [Tulasnella sp. JGI-2019a]|nr:hypothetical protein FRB94_014790 [Tulasnella sp. JGI-2019a]
MTNPLTASEIRGWFTDIQNGDKTFGELMQQHVDENVEWTVTCPGDGPLGKTTPIAGVYHSREAFSKSTMGPGGLFSKLTEGIKVKEVIDVLVQPSQCSNPSECHLTKAVVEWHGTGTIKKTGKGWDNYYAWVFHFNNESKKAVRVRAYLDSAAVNLAFEE